jgi:hypothetical protein
MMDRVTDPSVGAAEAWGIWAGGQPDCTNSDTTSGMDCSHRVVLQDSNGTIGS